MASILDRYGIKEVADVTFYKIGEYGTPTHPVLYLDTLKVSTIEQTAETSEAKGGKGNATLISWDYGKEITVTLEDALFSAKSMSIMFGNGTVQDIAPYDIGGNPHTLIMKTEVYTAKISQKPQQGSTNIEGWERYFISPDGKKYLKRNPKFYNADGTPAGDTLEIDQKYFCTYDLDVSGQVIEISANSFPGTYYVTGDTFARNEVTGDDEFFQFIIPKAKVTSENTITLEAEGDPSVFNMNLKVLRPVDGVMMKLVKYNLTNKTESDEEAVTSVLIHNHNLSENNNDTSVEVKTVTVTNGGNESVTLTTAVTNPQITVNKGIATIEHSDGTYTITGAAVGETTAIICDGAAKQKAAIKIKVVSGT